MASKRTARSANVDRFNHDDDASGYDRDVLNESNPIRAGYDELLSWVAKSVRPRSEVIDLGCGTGNLAVRLVEPSLIHCVDVSEKMIVIAKDKLAGQACQFVKADLLECFESLPVVDAVVSTYAIHHLTSAEKQRLFESVRDHLRPGGQAVFGDLMFESREAERLVCDELTSGGHGSVVADIEDEFFWYLDETLESLERLGFKTLSKRFSTLSFGITAVTV